MSNLCKCDKNCANCKCKKSRCNICIYNDITRNYCKLLNKNISKLSVENKCQHFKAGVYFSMF